MKTIYIYILLIIKLSSFLLANSHAAIKTGVNFSYLRNEEVKITPGFSFGITKNIYPIRFFNGYFGFGLYYQQKRFILEDRTWKSDIYVENFDVEKGNIDANIHYIDIPLKIGYTIKIRNQYASSIYMGPSLSIPLKNNTEIQYQETLNLTSEERNTYNYDYIPLDENYIIPAVNFHLGTKLSIKKIAIIANYVGALSVTEGITGLSLQDKIDSFEILAVFVF